MPSPQLDPRWAGRSTAPRTAEAAVGGRSLIYAVAVASALAGPEGKAAWPLQEFLWAIEPQLDALFHRFALTAPEAEEILRAALQSLAWRWETVRERETWLLTVLELRCKSAIEARTKAVTE